jgi:hypothetical protein
MSIIGPQQKDVERIAQSKNALLHEEIFQASPLLYVSYIECSAQLAVRFLR